MVGGNKRLPHIISAASLTLVICVLSVMTWKVKQGWSIFPASYERKCMLWRLPVKTFCTLNDDDKHLMWYVYIYLKRYDELQNVAKTAPGRSSNSNITGSLTSKVTEHIAVADSGPLEAIFNQEYKNQTLTALKIVAPLLSSDFPHLNKRFRTSKLAVIFWDHQLKWIQDAWTRLFGAHREEVKEDYLYLCIGTLEQ